MKSSGIGGQALMEGVMMKNGNLYACAVRKPDNEIIVDVQETKPISDRCRIFKWPILRGMVTFIDSMYLGVKTLTWSASFFEDEEETKDGKKASKKKDASEASESGQDQGSENSAAGAEASKPKEKTAKEKRQESLFMAGTVAIAIVLAVGIFMILPYFLSLLLKKFIDSPTILAICEGVIRIALFVGYVAAISCMKDIRRVFMYHGAEHKSINCVEQGYELTVSNVKKCSREHKRCGTSFLLIVMVISVIFFVFIRVDSTWLMVLIRLLLVPIIAGISYEFIRLAGRSDSKLVTFLSKPGLALQNFTTREPDDSMIECAIASVEAVFDWRKYQAEAKKEMEEAKLAKENSRERRRKERAEESKKRLNARGMDDTLSDEQERAVDAQADSVAGGQEIDIDAEIAAIVAKKKEERRLEAERMALEAEESQKAEKARLAAEAKQAEQTRAEEKAKVAEAVKKAEEAERAEKEAEAAEMAEKAAEKKSEESASEQKRISERNMNLKSEIEADVAKGNDISSKKSSKKHNASKHGKDSRQGNSSRQDNAAKQDGASRQDNAAKQDSAPGQDNAAKQDSAPRQDNTAKQDSNSTKEKNDKKNKSGFGSGRAVPGNNHASKQASSDASQKKDEDNDGDALNGYFKRPEKKEAANRKEMGGYYTSTNRNNVYVETMNVVENDSDEQDDVLNALDQFFVGKKQNSTVNTEKADNKEEPAKKEALDKSAADKPSENSKNSKKKAKKKK